MADKRRNLGIPSGAVFPFAGTTAPYGYLVCDGSAVSRASYPALFLSLGSGTLHGIGDGSTTFNLPDYRGKFMRGLDGTAGNDPDKAARIHPVTSAVVGDVVGSVQADAMQGHFHTLGGQYNTADAAANPANYLQATATGGAPITATLQNNNYISSPKSDGTNGAPRTSLESRPKNVNVNYIVKV